MILAQENVVNSADSPLLPKELSVDLFALKAKYPSLKVIPLVINQAVPQGEAAGEFQRWVGSVGQARIVRHIKGREGIYFKEDYADEDTQEMKDILADVMGRAAPDHLPEVIETFNTLPWETAIVVDINMAE